MTQYAFHSDARDDLDEIFTLSCNCITVLHGKKGFGAGTD